MLFTQYQVQKTWYYHSTLSKSTYQKKSKHTTIVFLEVACKQMNSVFEMTIVPVFSEDDLSMHYSVCNITHVPSCGRSLQEGFQAASSSCTPL